MELKDILAYTAFGVVTGGLSLATLNFIFLITSQTIFESNLLRRKIGRKELEKVVEEEARKLGLDSSRIYIRQSTLIKFCSNKEGDRYELHLDGNSCNVGKVRHELYHIKKDCDRGKVSGFRYFFIEEPRATLYGCFGIKI